MHQPETNFDEEGHEKYNTGTMAYGVSNKKKDVVTEIGRNPLSKHQIQHEYGDEQANAGRDCQTRLARPNSQARAGQGTASRIGSLTLLILAVAVCSMG